MVAAGVGEPMTRHDGSADGWLAAELAVEWQTASDRACVLSTQLEYLTWPDRAKELDRFFWSAANDRLGHGEITAVINRQVLGNAEARAVRDYAHQVKCVLTAVLILLNERPEIGSIWQGLTWLLGRRAQEHDPAQAWIRRSDPAALRGHLANLPGFAFLILAATQDDTVESFLARDAFWDAMLGETRDVGGGNE